LLWNQLFKIDFELDQRIEDGWRTLKKGCCVSRTNARLRRGDIVEVKMPDEILQTLDAEGTLNHLPFMPEMTEFCGQRFRVLAQALTICMSGPESPRGFSADDVVTLDGIRCSGGAHDGCQKACMIFWREDWLRKVDHTAVQSQVDTQALDRLRARLKVSVGPKIYYCQASELSKATHFLTRSEKWRRYISGLLAGNFNALQMAQSIGTWLLWKSRRMIFGIYARGTSKSTPVESLDLQPGEWIEVKSMQSIIETLNARGENRGLYFSPDMRLLCGRKCRVKGRLDKIIVDGTGQMRQLRNTVCLEGSSCGCSYMGGAMGGCSRCEVTYWREMWLRRSEGHTNSLDTQPSS
jgi:hypothetical protein